MTPEDQEPDRLRELIEARLDHVDATLRRVEVQTSATNGRVTALEKWQIETLAKEDQYLKDERLHATEDALTRSWIQPVITGLIVGLVTGVSLLAITLLVNSGA